MYSTVLHSNFSVVKPCLYRVQFTQNFNRLFQIYVLAVSCSSHVFAARASFCEQADARAAINARNESDMGSVGIRVARDPKSVVTSSI